MTTTNEEQALENVRRTYNRNARTYDLMQSLNERLAFKRFRRKLWKKAPSHGDILEIGVGTGVNIPEYPVGARVTAIDISDRMLERARARAERIGANVDLRLMDAQRLEFDDEAFDAVIATCVFCSVPDPVAGLREARRVLRPGGALLLMEHERSPARLVGRVMDILNPVVVRLAGANINRRTVENVGAAGFAGIDAEPHFLGILKLIEARTS